MARLALHCPHFVTDDASFATNKATLSHILNALKTASWVKRVSVCAGTVRLILLAPVVCEVCTPAVAVAEFSAHLRKTLVARCCEASSDSSFSRCEKLLVRPGGLLDGHKIKIHSAHQVSLLRAGMVFGELGHPLPLILSSPGPGQQMHCHGWHDDRVTAHASAGRSDKVRPHTLQASAP